MMVPFPYDVIAHWMAENDIKLSGKAYEELAQTIQFYCDRAEGKEVAVPEFLKTNE